MANLYLKRLQNQEIDYKKELVSYQTDYYSLGILAFELLYGEPPFGYCKPQATKDEKIEYLKRIIN